MKLSKGDVARYIEDFLNGTGGRWDWDDFISVPIDDPNLDKIRVLSGIFMTASHQPDPATSVARKVWPR